MSKVFKYEIPVRDTFQMQLPEGAKVLHFATQGPGQSAFIWALVDPNASTMTDRYFRLAGTGHDIGENPGWDSQYVGTTHTMGGALVWHLFELVPVFAMEEALA